MRSWRSARCWRGASSWCSSSPAASRAPAPAPPSSSSLLPTPRTDQDLLLPPAPLLLGLRLLPEKNQIFAHARRDGRQGGRKVDADRTREERTRERVCVRDGNGRTEEVGGDRNGGRWGCGVLDETPSPPCTAPTILRPGPGKRGAARHHTRLHRI